LEHVVPENARQLPADMVLRAAARRFLDLVARRPATWRIILLPPDGTPTAVRELIETNRAQALQRIEQLVRWALSSSSLPEDLDVELAARALRDLGEEAARMVLTDPRQYPPARYERFVDTVMALLWPGDETAH
jgi:hypothetical protein